MLARPVPAEITEEAWRKREELRERERRLGAWADVLREIGERYDACSLASFVVDGPEDVCKRKAAAVATVKEFGSRLREQRDSGGNLMLYGPPGTGKDHLLVALMRHAVLSFGMNVHWCNGQTLFGDFRDNIDRDVSERELLAKYMRPDVLAISDPVPPSGEISNYAKSMLYRIIDDRYRKLRCTWVTVNVATAKEAESSLSGPVFDRLRDNAVTVFCNWPSFRSTRKPEWLK